MKWTKVLMGFILVISLAAIGDALIHPIAYSLENKPNECSCHSLNPQTTPIQKLVFDPLVLAGIIIIVVGLSVVLEIVFLWTRKGKATGS